MTKMSRKSELRGEFDVHELMNRLAVAHRLSESHFERMLGKDGVTGGQFAYMLIICENPGISQRELSRRLMIDKGSVTRMVARLCVRGYVEQRGMETDRRVTLLFPTAAGERAYERLAPIATESEARLARSLSPTERHELARLLDKVVASLETPPTSAA